MQNELNRGGLLITMAQALLLGIVAGLGGYFLLSVTVGVPARAQAVQPGQPPAPPPGGPQGPPPMGFGGRGGFGGEERKVVGMFDKNGDERLDTAERKTAREALAAEGTGRRGFGRRGGPGGPGGPGGGRIESGSPGARLTPADVKSYSSEPLYDIGTLRTIFLQFENGDWEQELADFHNTDVEVPATVTVDGKNYTDVGVHFRGASSYMMVPEGLKRSLNLSFDYAIEKQEIGGYRTLNLLNANGDATFMRTVLYSDIARHYIPTPKANFVRVVINGESWGVYVSAAAVQQGLHPRLFQEHGRRPLEGAGQPGRPRRHGVSRRRSRDLQANLRDQDERRRRSPGRTSSRCSRC